MYTHRKIFPTDLEKFTSRNISSFSRVIQEKASLRKSPRCTDPLALAVHARRRCTKYKEYRRDANKKVAQAHMLERLLWENPLQGGAGQSIPDLFSARNRISAAAAADGKNFHVRHRESARRSDVARKIERIYRADVLEDVAIKLRVTRERCGIRIFGRINRALTYWASIRVDSFYEERFFLFGKLLFEKFKLISLVVLYVAKGACHMASSYKF